MNFSFRKNCTRNISLLLIALLTAVYCGSIDLSCDAFSAGGILKGNGYISITRSFIAPVSSSVREDNGRNGESEQNIEKASVASDLHPEEGGIVNLLVLDMDTYAEKYGNKAVRKNITIPAYMDTYAETHGLSLSKVMQDAISGYLVEHE